LRGGDGVLRLDLNLQAVGPLLAVGDGEDGRGALGKLAERYGRQVILGLLAAGAALGYARIDDLNLDGLLLLGAVLARHRYRQRDDLLLLAARTLGDGEAIGVDRPQVMDAALAARENTHDLATGRQVLGELGRGELVDGSRGQGTRGEARERREVHCR
jgi:hypothetical protein